MKRQNSVKESYLHILLATDRRIKVQAPQISAHGHLRRTRKGRIVIMLLLQRPKLFESLHGERDCRFEVIHLDRLHHVGQNLGMPGSLDELIVVVRRHQNCGNWVFPAEFGGLRLGASDHQQTSGGSPSGSQTIRPSLASYTPRIWSETLLNVRLSSVQCPRNSRPTTPSSST